MLVEYNTQASRNAEIETLIQYMAKQFEVTDPLDLADLRADVLKKIDSTKPLAEYKKMDKASSSHFRSSVRNAFIDLIAYFIQLRDLEASLRFAEYESRKIFDDFNSRRKELESLVQEEDTDLTHTETFSDEVENGVFAGVHIHDGRLRLRMEDISPPYQVQSITADVYPTANSRTQIFHSHTGELNTVLDTGLGSKLWATDIYTPERPEMYWTQTISGSSSSEGANYLHKGILIDIKLTLTKAIQLNYISAKFLTPTRLVRAYINTASETDPEVWVPLVTSENRFVQTWVYDNALEIFDFNATQSATQIRLVFNVNQPSNIVGQDFILDRMYSRKEIFQGVTSNNIDFDQQVLLPESFLYSFGLYNIRLRNRQPAFSHGSFMSDEYVTDHGAVIGTRLKATDSGTTSGALIYSISFGPQSEMAILPEDASRNIEELIDVDDGGYAFLSFPRESKSLKATGYRFTPVEYNGKELGSVFRVTDSNGQQLTKVKDIPVAYRAKQSSRYVFTTEDIDAFAAQYGGDEDELCTIFTRVSPDFWDGSDEISIYEAVPICSYEINETFFGQSLLELDYIPWMDYEGNYPVEIIIQPDAEEESISSLNHPDLIVDRTNYYNRQIQPLLENYDAVDQYEFFIKGNKVYLNTSHYHQLQINYYVKTEGITVQIDQQAKGHRSPWVDDYTLQLIVQKD